MKKLLPFILLLTGLIGSTLAQPSKAHGAGCTPIYGGGEDCPPTQNILIDKTVQNPSDGVFVDNLHISDHRFVADQDVVYRLRIENTGNERLSNVSVIDTLPDTIEFVSGPGSYDAIRRTLSFTLRTLGAGEKRVFDIHAQVAGIANLPTDQSSFCRVNSATATAGSATDRDTAQICIERQVLGAPELPATGPAGTIALVAGLAALFIVGQRLTLKKY